MEFNFDDYKGNYTMHCETQEEAEDFCKTMHETGRKWCNGKSYLEENNWNKREKNTCYGFNEGTYGSTEAYGEFPFQEKYNILEWSDFKESTTSGADKE